MLHRLWSIKPTITSCGDTTGVRATTTAATTGDRATATIAGSTGGPATMSAATTGDRATATGGAGNLSRKPRAGGAFFFPCAITDPDRGGGDDDLIGFGERTAVRQVKVRWDTLGQGGRCAQTCCFHARRTRSGCGVGRRASLGRNP